MQICGELKNAFESIKNLKHELDLEMQKEERERDYSKVQAAKEKIEEEARALQNKVNPIPEFLRGKEGVFIEELEIGGKTKEQLIQEMKEKNINISNAAMDILNSSEFTVSSKPESMNLIHLKVGDLGLPEGKSPTTDEIYKRIKDFGLELCPAEVGPNYRLKHIEQPMAERILIGMKQIEGRSGDSVVFCVERNGVGLWLFHSWADPTRTWNPGHEFVFCLRPPTHKAADGPSK